MGLPSYRPKEQAGGCRIHARGPDGDLVVIVEAKIKGGSLKPTDTDPASYLDLAEFSWAKSWSLIYLIDETDAQKTRGMIVDPTNRSGILTWQRLGGLRIGLALKLNCDPIIRDFVAGAIQYQYVNHNITPTRLVADYLVSEPARSEIHKDNPDRMKIWTTDWKIREKES